MKNFSGKVLFLDRSDINTDEIIPAKYLTEVTKEALKPFLFEDLKMDGFSTSLIPGKQVVVTKNNFGCGSSREHAPWALEVNDINLVIAPGFARIFRQNMYNCGMMAVELPENVINSLFEKFAGKQTSVDTDFSAGKFVFKADGITEEISFNVSDFDKALVNAGGWVDYADQKY
jgi:3-isopropylmalate/(R)-2-methylmalate dehydratase small subunit